MGERGDDDQGLGEERQVVEHGRSRGFGDEGGIEPALGNGSGQDVVGTGDELDPHIRADAVKPRQHRWQAAGRGALQGAHPQHPTRQTGHGTARLVGEPQ